MGGRCSSSIAAAREHPFVGGLFILSFMLYTRTSSVQCPYTVGVADTRRRSHSHTTSRVRDASKLRQNG